jgi:pimeloyl-ACP methyl ester carboxylesterase
MNLPPGVRSQTVDTNRLRTHFIESGPEDGVPVVLLHGNLSTGRFFEHLLPGAPSRYRFIAPDMRGFGDSEQARIDATRGLADWADDLHALLETLRVERPAHLAGWSTGGAAIAAYALDRPVASLTFIDPVSPFGYCGVRPDGTPNYPDFAGSGAGIVNPEFVQRLASGDRSSETPLSPRSVINAAYWSATHREPPEREEMLLDEVLKSLIGEDGYPGDSTKSENWPGVAPGTGGLINALSPKYCNWSGIVELEPKPPLLWTHGSQDIVIADGSPLDVGVLGKLGHLPGWPGEEVFPPQPMVSQIREVLERYHEAGGRVEIEILEGSGHSPFFDALPRWSEVFFGFLASVE